MLDDRRERLREAMVGSTQSGDDGVGKGDDGKATVDSITLTPDPEPSTTYISTMLVNELQSSVCARGRSGEICLGTSSS